MHGMGHVGRKSHGIGKQGKPAGARGAKAGCRPLQEVQEGVRSGSTGDLRADLLAVEQGDHRPCLEVLQAHEGLKESVAGGEIVQPTRLQELPGTDPLCRGRIDQAQVEAHGFCADGFGQGILQVPVGKADHGWQMQFPLDLRAPFVHFSIEMDGKAWQHRARGGQADQVLDSVLVVHPACDLQGPIEPGVKEHSAVDFHAQGGGTEAALGRTGFDAQARAVGVGRPKAQTAKLFRPTPSHQKATQDDKGPGPLDFPLDGRGVQTVKAGL
jgi:hypothetical protein